jgi:periplasmic divalent cation tolerance protein
VEKNTGKIVVLVTCGSRGEARKISRMVVETRLAACANVSGAAVESVYRWKRKVETAKEFLVLMKTTRRAFPRLQKAILEAHSYDVPEIIALPIVEGETKYLDWIGENAK